MQVAQFPGILRKWKRLSMGYQKIGGHENEKGCYPCMIKRHRRNAVTFVVGKEMERFTVDPQILECGLFEPLLETAGDKSPPDDDEYYEEGCIFLKCDALLFDHMLWLVQNQDPSLRCLNLEVLIEFYAQEDCVSVEHKPPKLLPRKL